MSNTVKNLAVAGAVAAGMAWLCMDTRSWAKIGSIFAIGVLLTITAPAVWAKGGIIIDAAPILVGLVVGLIGGQICAGLTWEEGVKARFVDRLQDRCDLWVSERLHEADALNSGKEFKGVVIALRPVGHKIFPEALHQRLQRTLKSAGAIVDDTQVQNLIGVVPAVESESDVARVVYDGVEMLRQEVFESSAQGSDEADFPAQFRVVVRVGLMQVMGVERLDGREDIAVGGAALTDALEWLYYHVGEREPKPWDVVYDREFTEVDEQILSARADSGLIAGENAYALTKRPDDVPAPTPAAPTPSEENTPVVRPRTIRAKVAKKVELPSVEEKVVAQSPKRIKLTVKTAPVKSEE
mgnify:CR=1 FL=1